MPAEVPFCAVVLVGFNRTSGLTQAWNLSAGDWNSVTTNGTAETRTHVPTHDLLTGADQNVTTDSQGNITLIPAVLRSSATPLALNIDFYNRLNTADVGNNGSADVTYKFDAFGRRVFRDDGTSATVYVQAGQQTITDYTAGEAATSPEYRYQASVRSVSRFRLESDLCTGSVCGPALSIGSVTG